ncbi:unnamed protein product [Leptosia nina]|uniref:Uncharacterized protein n=1 Tax=Leptosia nina TaxID=320188 RepID=A0AAV1JVZ8_9NEOP
MKNYRTYPKYKRFIDYLQLSLQCCGLKSYKDWFKHDWHDKARDYDLEPLDTNAALKRDGNDVDSVPLSCCKSGSCVSSFLDELGTNSINTSGCGSLMYHVIIVTMNIHLVLFVAVILLEILILRCVVIHSTDNGSHKMLIDHIMPVNENFDMSSESCHVEAEDSDDGIKNNEKSNAIRDL